MPTTKIYNMEGKEVGTRELSPKVFGITSNLALIHQVVTARRANIRQTLAHTKKRGEVSGGGKKPWKQKGTGRARQGSIRSPQWVGGGVVFGPRSNRNFHQKINKKMARAALLGALSEKASAGQIVLVDHLEFKEPKTKIAAAVMKKLPVGKSTLIVIPIFPEGFTRTVRNLPRVMSVTSKNVGIADVLKYETLLMTVDGVNALEERFKK